MQKPLINNQIRDKEVRVIDKQGENLGVLSLTEALGKAKEQNLDLIQVTRKIQPSICKIGDYGKYLYSLQKKERKVKSKKIGELKGIRLRFNISLHDLQIRAKTAEKFIQEGKKVRIEMVLRGREKALGEFARKKVEQFLEILKAKLPIKVEKELKREARGFTMIVSRDTKKE